MKSGGEATYLLLLVFSQFNIFLCQTSNVIQVDASYTIADPSESEENVELNCCKSLRLSLNLEKSPQFRLERFETVFNNIGFVNDHPYWLSGDKQSVIYHSSNVSTDVWVVGEARFLGAPATVHSWIVLESDDDSCPEKSQRIFYWNAATKEMLEDDEQSISLTCEKKYEDDLWMKKHSMNELEELVHQSSTEDLCGRRPWTNVMNYREVYTHSISNGYSGLPYGPPSEPLSSR